MAHGTTPICFRFNACRPTWRDASHMLLPHLLGDLMQRISAFATLLSCLDSTYQRVDQSLPTFSCHHNISLTQAAYSPDPASAARWFARRSRSPTKTSTDVSPRRLNGTTLWELGFARRMAPQAPGTRNLTLAAVLGL